MWTIQISDAKKSLGDWGISGLQRRRSSQAADVVTFALASPYDAAISFAADDEIQILKGAEIWFRGRVTAIRPSATGRDESIQVEVSGPWWYLERSVYEQIWRWYDGSPYVKGHAILNQTDQGQPLGTRGQIIDALTVVRGRALARYGTAPFQWESGTFPDIQIPSDEVRDVTCAEVIRKQIRWLPDAVTWFDYSVTPPMLRIARRGGLAAIDLGPDDAFSQHALTPRHDLQVPSVCIKFERTDTVDGRGVLSLSKQISPAGATGEEFGALVATVDLIGFSSTSASATIVTADFPVTPRQNPGTDVTAADKVKWTNWLKRKQGWLNDPNVEIVDVISVGRQSHNESGLWAPRELTAGSIPPWLNAPTWDETVSIRLKLRTRLPGGEISDQYERTFSVNTTGTFANTGTYSTVTSAAAGEVEPPGLAFALYQALGVLEWQGAVTLVEREITGRVSIGNRLNLIGRRPEWETMNATVQEVDENIDSGETTIRFGPPQHLGPRDLVELLRVGRFRYTSNASSSRSTGAAPSGALSLGGPAPKENGEGGATTRERFVVKSAISAGSVVLDGDQCAGKILAVREVEVCLNGNKFKQLFICSDPY